MKCNFCNRDQPECGAVATSGEVAICETCARSVSSHIGNRRQKGSIDRDAVFTSVCYVTDEVQYKDLVLEEGVVSCGTAIIMIKNGLICSGVRGDGCGHGRGRRAFPGGHIDHPDETLAMAGRRENIEETGCVAGFRNLGGGYDLLTTLHITNDDGLKRYLTTYLIADYIEGGDWINEHTLRGQEPEKIERWDFHTWDALKIMIRAERKKLPGEPWWPMDALEQRMSKLGVTL